MTKLEDVMAEVTKSGRVCPQPAQWNRLWELLPGRQRNGVGSEPPAPLILAAWHYTSDSDKRERFHLHLRWADEHDALDQVAALISSLRPGDWHSEQ